MIEQGQSREAQLLLAHHLRAHPEDARAWWLLSQVLPTRRQQLWCLDQVLRLQPMNVEARARKGVLQRQALRVAAPQPARASTSRNADLGYLPLALLFTTLCVLIGVTLALLRIESRSSARPTPQPTASQSAGIPSNTPTPIEPIPTNTPTPLPDARVPPEQWRAWPVIPRISQRARDVFQEGIARGNDARRFTILGDCHSMPDVMFGPFDEAGFTLPEAHAGLQAVRDYYAGQFARQPVTVNNGMDEAKLFSVLWNDPDRCEYDEPPLKCELRIHNPSIAIISLGTNWGTSGDEKYRDYMRRILDLLLSEGVLPVITTVADQEAGADFPLNRIMAELAYEYDLPLWNFWRLAQSLPNNGLSANPQEPFHLISEAWEARRYSGLAVLDAVLQAVR